eukprot:1153150-Pelagomonas_calceolata.AAC.1
MSASLQPTYGVSGQASGIPAVVTGELAGQVGGGVGAVGSCGRTDSQRGARMRISGHPEEMRCKPKHCRT